MNTLLAILTLGLLRIGLPVFLALLLGEWIRRREIRLAVM